MSYGYRRTMSPAAIAEKRRREAGARIRHLHKCRCEELREETSSMVLNKGDPEMTNITGFEKDAYSLAKKAKAAADNGQLSQFALNQLMQALAKEIGGDMNKFLKTATGQVFLEPRGNVSAGQQIALLKREGYADFDKVTDYSVSPPAFPSPGVYGDSVSGTTRSTPPGNQTPPKATARNVGGNDATSDGGKNYAAVVQLAIERLMSQGFSYDQAVTRVYRTEKMQKGL